MQLCEQINAITTFCSYLINIVPRWSQCYSSSSSHGHSQKSQTENFCNNCNKPISNFSGGAETKYAALDGKVGWDVYKISLQIETLCSGLPFARSHEAWEEAGRTSAVFPFFPYIANRVPPRSEVCCAEGQTGVFENAFSFCTLTCGIWGK